MRALFRELAINQPADVSVARHVAGQMAAEQNFPSQRLAEIRLMASELAQNLLDHKAINGRIRVSSLRIQGVPGLTLASIDNGPGIADVSGLLASTSGYRSATGLGAGLASIRRLADHFALCSGREGEFGCRGSVAEQGTIVVAHSWPYNPPPISASSQFDIAGIVCGRSENMPCGDGLFVSGDDRFLRIVLVDSPGLGKGCAITREVRKRLQEMDMVWPPDQLFEQLSFALKAGISMKILRFDSLLQEVQWAGVGNISTWIVVDGVLQQVAQPQPMAQSQYSRVPLFCLAVQRQMSCLVHSDGLSPFDQAEVADLLTENRCNDSNLALQSIYSRNKRSQDDSAICIWQWAKS